jgi:phage terminase large subunit-like protein
MQALHAKSRTQDGLNVSMAFADEFHAHAARGMWDVITTATGARSQPLVSAITTAGSNIAGPCYETRDYLCKVLEGALEDDELWGSIYTLDDGDDWQDPAVWIKANPNLGVSVSLDDLLGKLAEARATPDAAATFKTKHLNIWVGARKAFYDLAAWQACADPTLRMEDFQGCRCWFGIDLAQTRDTNALMVLFERDGEFYVFARFYLPEEKVKENRTGTHAHFQRWAEQGHLRLTPGDVVDLDVIERDVAELCAAFRPVEIPYDPYQSTQMVTHLLEAGAPMVEFSATAKFMSPPMKELARLMSQSTRRIHHDGNPVMTWMMGNVTARMDAKDNVYPRKEFEQNKIDGPVALMMAIGRSMAPVTQIGLPMDPALLLPTA